MVIWVTGAPGSGKTTTAIRFAESFANAVILDAEDCRVWLTPDCGFSPGERATHVARMLRVAKYIDKVGGVAICSSVTPPHESVDLLVLCRGRQASLWEGTTYTPPADPDLVVDTS